MRSNRSPLALCPSPFAPRSPLATSCRSLPSASQLKTRKPKASRRAEQEKPSRPGPYWTHPPKPHPSHPPLSRRRALVRLADPLPSPKKPCSAPPAPPAPPLDQCVDNWTHPLKPPPFTPSPLSPGPRPKTSTKRASSCPRRGRRCGGLAATSRPPAGWGPPPAPPAGWGPPLAPPACRTGGQPCGAPQPRRARGRRGHAPMAGKSHAHHALYNGERQGVHQGRAHPPRPP
jgi:hypothetical protein